MRNFEWVMLVSLAAANASKEAKVWSICGEIDNQKPFARQSLPADP